MIRNGIRHFPRRRSHSRLHEAVLARSRGHGVTHRIHARRRLCVVPIQDHVRSRASNVPQTYVALGAARRQRVLVRPRPLDRVHAPSVSRQRVRDHIRRRIPQSHDVIVRTDRHERVRRCARAQRRGATLGRELGLRRDSQTIRIPTLHRAVVRPCKKHPGIGR